MDTFDGKVAVITGAASGIGLAVATRLFERGARVVMADVEEAALRKGAATLGPPGSLLTVVTDVSLADSVEALRDRTEETFGPVDLLFNNAGVESPEKSAALFPLAEWEWVIGVNLWGVIHGVRSFLPGMIDRGNGHIVNTASGVVFNPRHGYAPHVTSKWAVAGLTASIHDEMAKRKLPIGVSLLCPRLVRTYIHTAHRNWPARLGAPPEAQEPAAADPGAVPGYWARAVDPLDVADDALAGILEGKFWITTGHSEDELALHPVPTA